MSRFTVHQGDCLAIMPTLPEASMDSIVTDPPYGLSFMGKDWDHGVPGVAFWREALRVAKPGAFLLAFGGTRTFHRLTCAIEDAGWDVRDCIMWVYGSGFPKSHDVSKAIDKAAGAEREVTDIPTARHGGRAQNRVMNEFRSKAYDSETGLVMQTIPATEAAQRWQGWGTALKPAWEPIIVARRPLCGTVADNVLRYGTGAMNVDGCRVGTTKDVPASPKRVGASQHTVSMPGGSRDDSGFNPNIGRWPANLIHDGSEEVVQLFPANAGGGYGVRGSHSSEHLKGKKATYEVVGFGDSGSAARFFYCAKASKADRDAGCEELEAKELKGMNASPREGHGEVRNSNRYGNHHPTVKPTDLMRYLCRLVTQPGGTVLDPFTGSGSTGKAAMLEGLNFVGIEREEEYVRIAEARVEAAWNQIRKSAATDLFGEKECNGIILARKGGT